MGGIATTSKSVADDKCVVTIFVQQSPCRISHSDICENDPRLESEGRYGLNFLVLNQRCVVRVRC
jgi:hypothetical protein